MSAAAVEALREEMTRAAARLREQADAVYDSATGRRWATHGLAVLRVGYGLAILGILLSSLNDWQRIWGTQSPFTSELMQRYLTDAGALTLFTLSDSAWWSTLLLTATVVAALLFALGWRTRLVTPVLFVLVVSWHERNPLVVDGGDNVLRLVLVYLLLADCSAVWSLDARRRRLQGRAGTSAPSGGSFWRACTVLHNTAIVAVIVQICYVYLASAMFKVQGSMWQNGTALYYTLRVAEFSPWPGLSELLYPHASLITALTYGTVFFQIAFPFLLLNRTTRGLAVLGGIGLHGGIAVLMGLPFFSLTMIATEMVLVSERRWHALAHLAGRLRQQQGSEASLQSPRSAVSPQGHPASPAAKLPSQPRGASADQGVPLDGGRVRTRVGD